MQKMILYQQLYIESTTKQFLKTSQGNTKIQNKKWECTAKQIQKKFFLIYKKPILVISFQ